MKYPKLVRPQDCTTPVTVTIFTEGLTEDGAPARASSMSLYCHRRSSSKRTYDRRHAEVTLTAVLYFCADFCPDFPEIPEGEVVLDGVRRRIVSGKKARDPDGTVNYIRLEVA